MFLLAAIVPVNIKRNAKLEWKPLFNPILPVVAHSLLSAMYNYFEIKEYIHNIWWRVVG